MSKKKKKVKVKTPAYRIPWTDELGEPEKHLYFYAGIIPGDQNHGYVSGTLTVDKRIGNDEEYEEVLKSLEEAYGSEFSMLNFNHMGLERK